MLKYFRFGPTGNIKNVHYTPYYCQLALKMNSFLEDTLFFNFWTHNDLEKTDVFFKPIQEFIAKKIFWLLWKLKIFLIVTFDKIVTERWVRGQSGGSWGWQTQLDHSQVCSICISRAYTCIHVKYTCYTSGNGLVMLAILKNPNKSVGTCILKT